MRHQTRAILTLLCSAAVLHLPASAQISPLSTPVTISASDQAVLDMNEAYRKGDKKRLAELLPLARGNLLEPWAAYWALRARLREAQPAEVDQFLRQYAGTYQEDRLRNDWLLLLGQRRDWAGFKALHGAFRMNDDPQVQCYALLVERLDRGTPVAAPVAERWLAARNDEDACTTAAELLVSTREMPEATVWQKARLAIEANRPEVARKAVGLLSADLGKQVSVLNGNPARYLAQSASSDDRQSQELALLAIIKLASSDADSAAAQLKGGWERRLTAEERAWAWGQIGKQATLSLSGKALGYFTQVKSRDLNADHLIWKTRAALRAGDWAQVKESIEAMDRETRSDSAWVYWHARSLQALGRGDAQQQAARAYASIAGTSGFYEMMALEALGRPVTLPPQPQAVTPSEQAWALREPGLQRSLQAIAIGLRGEGVREWNYTIALAQPGGLPDRQLLAAAQLACEREIWDRCINTSERTREQVDILQRFPLPLKDLVVPRSLAIGLDPAYVYGLIRQESRFVTHARSGAGASGLMQVMPATARWTARKIGMTDFAPSRINEREVNVTIGTAYLKLALDDFDGSMAMASAAYNAGPGRPRNWRAPGGTGPVLEAAIWAENIPFAETRDYVKKVLANTTLYAALLHEPQQSLVARLGQVGPRPSNDAPIDADLP